MAGRRSKYEKIKTRLDEIEKLAGYGLIDTEIADFIDVSIVTFNAYKKRHPEFLKSLKKGKLIPDVNVVESLLKRAIGYEFEEVTIEEVEIDGGESSTKLPGKKVKRVKKHIPGDVTACAIWLNNRRKQDWRQKVEDPQYDAPDIPADIDSLPASEVNRLYDEIRNKKD